MLAYVSDGRLREFPCIAELQFRCNFIKSCPPLLLGRRGISVDGANEPNTLVFLSEAVTNESEIAAESKDPTRFNGSPCAPLR